MLLVVIAVLIQALVSPLVTLMQAMAVLAVAGTLATAALALMVGRGTATGTRVTRAMAEAITMAPGPVLATTAPTTDKATDPVTGAVDPATAGTHRNADLP